MRRVFLATALLTLTSVLLVLGCDWIPHLPEYYPDGPGGAGGSGAWNASSSSGLATVGSGGDPSCDGVCAPEIPQDPVVEWVGPALFVFGPAGNLGPCPDGTTNGFEAFDGLSAEPYGCPACACGPSATACSIPTDWHASAAKCPGLGAPQLDFSAPADWSGGCSPGSSIPAGLTCSGVPCVQSVTVDGPKALPAACVPAASGEATQPPVQWETGARECQLATAGQCLDGRTCVPDVPDDFALCIYRGGDVSCPAAYDDRHLVYRSAADTRGCAPCACGPPEGGSCTVLVKAASDNACGALVVAALVSSEQESACFDVVPGTALASKAVEVAFASPGGCIPAGGEPSGLALPDQAVTVCCEPPLPALK
jgi:hypothetical protein